MKFWKMNGAGNDFVIINNMDGAISADKWPVIAKTVCTRRLSVGADGIMVVEPAEGEADYKMTYYNADGSLGEMCGNGARCIARYGYENGLAGEVQTIEVTAGVVTGWRITDRQYKIRLNDPSVIKLDQTLEVDGVSCDYDYVELGDPGIPHIAVAVKGLRSYPERELFELGRKMRYYKDFPKGANVNFYEIEGENLVWEKTYERGVEDFTLACGTGTGSVGAVLALKGLTGDKNIRIGMGGGELTVDVVRDGDKVTELYITGPTNIVAKGEITDEELTF